MGDWIRYATTVNATAVAPKGHLLSGTAKDPTQASFGLTRGFADGSNVPHNKTSSGLQLSFTKTSIVSVPMVEFDDPWHQRKRREKFCAKVRLPVALIVSIVTCVSRRIQARMNFDITQVATWRKQSKQRLTF